MANSWFLPLAYYTTVNNIWLQFKPKTCTLNSLESLWCVSEVHIYFCDLYCICKADFCQEHQIIERKKRKFVKGKKIHFGQWESLFQCKTWSVQVWLVFNIYCTIIFNFLMRCTVMFDFGVLDSDSWILFDWNFETFFIS